MSSRSTIGTFLAVTCGFSWGLLGIFHLAGGQSGSPMFLANAVLAYGLGPVMGALYLQWKRREPALSLLGGDPFPNIWFLVAWALPPLVALAAMFLAPRFDAGVELTFDLMRKVELLKSQLPADQYETVRKNYEGISAGLFFISQFTPTVLIGATVSAALALGEVIGWQHVLYRELRPRGFWAAALGIGVVRGLWALPLAFDGFPYPHHPHQGALLVLPFSLFLSITSTWLREKGGNVLPAALFLGGLNAASNTLPTMFLLGGTDLTTGIAGIPGLVALAVVALGATISMLRTRTAPAALAAAE